MNLITRDFFNHDIRIIKQDEEYDFNRILLGVNLAKNYLINERNAKRGDKVFMATTMWPNYLCWFIAASELGMGFVVSDFPLLYRSKSVNKKLSLYGEIQHVIKGDNKELHDFFNDKQNTFWKDKIIDHRAYENYTFEDNDTIWAEPTDVLIYATSSGTTGTPTVDAYTHEFFYKLAERNANLYKLEKTDRCLHTRNLHHGSVCGVYFLPTLRYCNEHHICEYPETSMWVDQIQNNNINRALFFYDMTKTFVEHADKEIINDIGAEYFVLSPVDDAFLSYFEDKSKIFSVFGSGETCGPLFLPQVTKQQIETKNFGKQLDNFYDISIRDGIISVQMPDGRITTSGDMFEIVDNEFIHKGRNNLYRINGNTLYLDVLIEVVQEILDQKHTKDFDIVFDKEYHAIYMRSDTHIDLEKLNSKIVELTGLPYYKITKQINQSRDKFYNGIKFDPFDVRLACRDQ